MHEKLADWCNDNPEITQYFKLLNAHKIRWAIFAGTSANLLTSNRQPTDLDLIVHDDDFNAVQRLTPAGRPQTPIVAYITTGDGYRLRYEGFELAFPLASTDVEVMARARETYDNVMYNLSFSNLAVAHRLAIELPQLTVYLANPFDTMAIKATMQRGLEQGKFDLADSKALVSAVAIDKNYARSRAAEMNLDARAITFLRQAGLLLN